jgi:hypothetical protein
VAPPLARGRQKPFPDIQNECSTPNSKALTVKPRVKQGLQPARRGSYGLDVRKGSNPEILAPSTYSLLYPRKRTHVG